MQSGKKTRDLPEIRNIKNSQLLTELSDMYPYGLDLEWDLACYFSDLVWLPGFGLFLNQITIKNKKLLHIFQLLLFVLYTGYK